MYKYDSLVNVKTTANIAKEPLQREDKQAIDTNHKKEFQAR